MSEKLRKILVVAAGVLVILESDSDFGLSRKYFRHGE